MDLSIREKIVIFWRPVLRGFPRKSIYTLTLKLLLFGKTWRSRQKKRKKEKKIDG